MRLIVAVAVLLGGGLIAASCGSESDGGAESLCNPGDNLFCKCKGTGEGTKTCKPDGAGFDPCINARGDNCDEIEPSGPGGPSPGAGGFGEGGAVGHESATTGEPVGGGGPGGAGGGGTGTKELYESCCDDTGCHNDMCKSGWCPMGFCTEECVKYEDCIESVGDCISVGDVNVCLPYCDVKDDCEGAFGKPSTCGYSTSIDKYHFTTCADWGGSLDLPPDGSTCSDDSQCHLGNPGNEYVCVFQACTTGCFDTFDCPVGQDCPGGGQLDHCE